MIETEQNKKYVTLESGIDFRTIAKIMTENGFKMNHATARNQLILAIQHLLLQVASKVKGPRMKMSEVEVLLKDQEIHDHLGDILYMAFQNLENQEEEEENNEY